MVKKGLADMRADVEARDLATAPKYVVRNAAEICRMNVAPPTEIWGGINLTNDVNMIVGPSGIGKSRIVLQLAISQVLGHDFPVSTDVMGSTSDTLPKMYKERPLKWLLMGTENSLYRYSFDLKKMTQTCTADQMQIIEEHVFMTTLEGEGDSYMAVDCDENVNKIKATLAAVMPDVVVFDPWGDICGGSELDDNTVRNTVAILRTLRPATKEAMPIIIMNHSRMGARENLSAVGIEGMNYAKNSKALTTIVRCQWNLFNATPDNTENPMIGFTNAKRSNGPKYPDFGVLLNPEYMSYESVKNYNPEEIKENLQAAAINKPNQNKEAVRVREFKNQLEKGIAAVKKAVEINAISKTTLDTVLKEAGVAVGNIKNVVNELPKHGFASYREPIEHGKVLWGTNEQIERIRKHYEEK